MREIKLKVVIFDLDGTLVDAYPAIIASFNHTMKKMGYPSQSAAVIRKAVGWGDKNLLKPFVKQKDLKKALDFYRMHHARSLLRGATLYPGTLTILRYLKNKGLRLAIASNRPTKFTLIILRHLKIRRYFDKVLCADKLANKKPHPQILKEIMGQLGVLADTVLYVGDMTIDAKTGKRAGVRTVIVTTGSSTRAQISKEKPLRIIERIDQLATIIT